MQEQELKGEISRILDQQIQCVLATLEGNQPCQHMMAFAYAEDLSRIYLATYMDTRKYRNMLSSPGVSILWDNRSGRDEDHIDGFSLIALGRAKLLPDDLQIEIRKLLLERNPSLNLLLDDASSRIFEVSVEDYQWTRGYREVFHYSTAK
jgi:uncharacterized pyridoxamine 5'-phosphate oxidase family protein